MGVTKVFWFLTTACRITLASSRKQHTYCALCTGLVSMSHTLWPSCLTLTRGVLVATYCIKFKSMHSLLFFHMPCYLDTHQVLLKLSIQYQAILLGYGNSPVSLWNCFPQYSPVSLKSASPTETVRAATVWIHFLFNILDAETEFIGFLGVICGTALFAQGELHPFMSLLKWVVLSPV